MFLSNEEVKRLRLSEEYKWRIESVSSDQVIVVNDMGDFIYFDLDKSEIRSELIKSNMSFKQSVVIAHIIFRKNQSKIEDK